MDAFSQLQRVKNEKSLLRQIENRAVGLSLPFTERYELPKEATFAGLGDLISYPTIAMARQFSIATLASLNLSVTADEGTGDDVINFLQEDVIPLFYDYVDEIAANVIDYGYSPFQLILKGDEFKLRSLLPKLTKVVMGKYGEFLGFTQIGEGGQRLYLPEDVSVLFNIQQRGDNYYGLGLTKNVIKTYESLMTLEKLTDRYLYKIAGHNIVIYYPPDSTGDNKELAEELANQWTSTAIVTAESRESPKYVDDLVNEKAVPGWHFEVLEPTSSSNTNFNTWWDNLQTLAVRSYLLPERSVLEAQHGSKADSETHTDVAIKNYNPFAKRIINQFKDQVVDRLLKYYFVNPEVNKIKLNYTFGDKKDPQFLRQIAGDLARRYPAAVDIDALFDELKIPKSDTTINVEQDNQATDKEDNEVDNEAQNN